MFVPAHALPRQPTLPTLCLANGIPSKIAIPYFAGTGAKEACDDGIDRAGVPAEHGS